MDASNSAQVPGESEGAVDAASFMNILKEARNVIILVNKMDAISWSEEKYVDVVNAFQAQLKDRGFDLRKVKTIPISALHGDNMLDSSLESPWYVKLTEGASKQEPGWTVIEAMDE